MGFTFSEEYMVQIKPEMLFLIQNLVILEVVESLQLFYTEEKITMLN